MRKVKLLDTGQRNTTTATVLEQKKKRGKYNKRYYEANKERILQYVREYVKRPYVQERIRQYESRPEAKEYRKLHRREYYQRPEVIARRQTAEKKAKKAAYDKEYGKKRRQREKEKEKGIVPKSTKKVINTDKGVRKNA